MALSTDDYHAAMDSVPIVSTIDLNEYTRPGGLVEDLIDWIVSSSARPSRVLALAAVIPFLGALMGRRFAGPSDLRTNFYTLGIAPSGFGKDHARAQLKRMVLKAGLEKFAGPGRFMSASALRNALMIKPSCFCLIDEFGGMMKQITDRRAGIHNQLIKSDLLELFSSSATYFEGAEYAGATAKRIHNPNLGIYGTSTPEYFWESVSSSNASDGLLPRFLLFNVEGRKPKRVMPTRDPSDVPMELVERCQAIVAAKRGNGNLRAVGTDNGESIVVPFVVNYSNDAKSGIADFEDFIELTEANADSRILPFLHRACEHAKKLSVLLAVADNLEKPIVSGHHMGWAIELAWHSTVVMIDETRDRIADNPREADVNRILSHIKKADKKGITPGMVADRCRSIDKRRREEVIADLVLSGRITRRQTPTSGRPSDRLYFVG